MPLPSEPSCQLRTECFVTQSHHRSNNCLLLLYLAYQCVLRTLGSGSGHPNARLPPIHRRTILFLLFRQTVSWPRLSPSVHIGLLFFLCHARPMSPQHYLSMIPLSIACVVAGTMPGAANIPAAQGAWPQIANTKMGHQLRQVTSYGSSQGQLCIADLPIGLALPFPKEHGTQKRNKGFQCSFISFAPGIILESSQVIFNMWFMTI